VTTESVQAARVAVLGAGAIAQVVHLPILTRMRGVQVVGLHDADRPKAVTIAQRFGIPRVFDSPDDLWKADDLDAVIVCTPSHFHETQSAEGVDSGKYVFCEKPLALTAEGAERVLRSASDSPRLMVGMNQRFRPDASALKDSTRKGDLGEIRYVRAGWLNRRVPRMSQGWRQQKSDAGGGVLMELGIQMLDLSLWLLDYPAPKRLVAHLHAPSAEAVEDSAIVLLELEDRRIINLEVTWTLVADRERQYLQLIGDNGSAGFPPLKVFTDAQGTAVDVSPQLPPGRENPFTASYRQELVAFVDAVRAGTAIDPPLEQVRLMSIVQAAYRSAEEATEVTF
jgi:predicted dehydrogenase